MHSKALEPGFLVKVSEGFLEVVVDNLFLFLFFGWGGGGVE